MAILQKEQRVLVSELSKRYDVTDETIRRDLEKLESEGYVKRTYGGAVLNKNTNVDMPLRIREKTNRSKSRLSQSWWRIWWKRVIGLCWMLPPPH